MLDLVPDEEPTREVSVIVGDKLVAIDMESLIGEPATATTVEVSCYVAVEAVSRRLRTLGFWLGIGVWLSSTIIDLLRSSTTFAPFQFRYVEARTPTLGVVVQLLCSSLLR